MCKDFILTSYYLTKGNPFPELAEKDGRIVFMFEKSEKLMEDFKAFKEDEFMKEITGNYYELKKAIWNFRQANKEKAS